MTHAILIALDWGSTNVRASLLGADASVIDQRIAPQGILAVQGGAHGAVLESLCGDWLAQHAVPLLASGMIGSRQGWKEAPYLDAPAGLGDAVRALTSVPTGVEGRLLHIVPGVRYRSADGVWDAMRGEETQIWGAFADARLAEEPRICLLPGTHSKWVWVDAQGRIERFQTYMTGELYALLSTHSILAKLMLAGQDRPDAFALGVRRGLARAQQTLHLLFSARTEGLLGGMAGDDLPDYLSGLLIGCEIAGALSALGAQAKSPLITLIGGENLCSRYASALDISGVKVSLAPSDAANLGLWKIAQFGPTLRLRDNADSL